MCQCFPQEILKQLVMDYRTFLTRVHKFGTLSLQIDEKRYYSEYLIKLTKAKVKIWKLENCP